ncbi:MAG: hypothetical protein U5L74_01580 [Ideonella sp.]|nr:hypothetical protein [Ideonella sp.]
MTTSNHGDNATLERLRATADKCQLPGPRDADVRPLSDLVDMLEIGLALAPLEARRVAVEMLSGAVGDGFDWRGTAAHQLPIFERTTKGTFEVSATVPRLEDVDGLTVYPSKREMALAHFLNGEPMPWLVVCFAAAHEALGIDELRRSLSAPELPPPADPAEDLFKRMESAGVWPRRKAEKGRKATLWTDAERDAAFELRSGYRVPDDLLLVRIGVTRQALDLAIGGATAPLTNRWPKSWGPSPELLRRCGFPVPEMTLQDTRKPAPVATRKAA